MQRVMKIPLLLGALLLATAARATGDFSVEVTPDYGRLEPGETLTFQIATKVVSGNPAPFELWVLLDEHSYSPLAFDIVDTKSPMDAVNGNIMTVPGETRTYTIRARENAAGGQQVFGITTHRDGEPDRHFMGGVISIQASVLGRCPPGYHVEGNSYCAPDIPVGCESASAGWAFLGLPLLLLLRRRGGWFREEPHWE